jgi:hypothetical protein
MKNSTTLRILFTVLFCTALLACSNDDSDNDGNNPDYAISYAKFTVSGPTTEGNFDFRDTSGDDDFSILGYFYDASEDPELTEDQIQLYIGKSYTESNFLIVAPPTIDTHNLYYEGGSDDHGISIVLSTLEDSFTTKNVTLDITELVINGNSLIHCKGTFSGTFYRYNLNENDVHYISGDFELKR